MRRHRRCETDLREIVWESANESTSVWDVATGRLRAHTPVLEVPVFDACHQARLTITTPLRLQDNGRPLAAHELSPRKLVAALIRRGALLFEFHAGRPGWGAGAPALAQHAQTLTDERDLAWHDWSRYSSRQKQTMTLGGVLGTWTLHGDLAPVLPWLWLGQWLHAGKNTTMGMGNYRLMLN